ncbi:MAG: tetratricopeptide repeat protein [Acidobacteriota bacterium]
MRSSLTPLPKLFYNPLQAMADLAARTPYFTGTALALVSTFLYYSVLSGMLQKTIGSFGDDDAPGLFAPFILFAFQIIRGTIASAPPVFFVIVVFVPACVLAASIIERRASFSVLLRQEYAALASCALYSWAVAHLLMFVLALLMFKPGGPNAQALESAMRIVPLPYFLFLVVLALRVALRLSFGRAVAVMALGACSLLALPLIPRLAFILTSPLMLILVFILLRNMFGDVLSAQRSRENFRRNLEAATLNPADASAHYNLGLIHQQRGQLDEAKERFARAVDIDADETDAHYQLGRIARDQGRLADAIAHFEAVVQRDPEHSLNEVWREIGRTYFEAGQLEDSRGAFERFIERRPSDAEGRYRYGLTLKGLGRGDDAASEMRACIEAVRTSPTYKYRAEKHWMSEAEAFLRQ